MDNLCRPLVTGGAGFVGSHLIAKLSELKEVEKVYCVDLPNARRLDVLRLLPKVEVIETDLSRDDSINVLPDDATAVFALAAWNGTSNFYSNPFKVLLNSSSPTINTLKKYSGVAPIVYSSSSEVYANTITTLNAPIPTSEEVITSIGDSKNPRWSYAMGKLFGEIALSAACNEMNATGVILRYHNLYGPDMGLDHFVSEFVNRVQNDDISIQGGTSTRSFLYISEAVEATIKSLEYVKEIPEIFNIGSIEELSIFEASRIILKKMGVDPKRIRSTAEPMGSVYRRCPDISKIEKVFGWKPEINFEQGIDLYLASLSS